MSTTEQDPAFETLLEYIRTNRGFDFTGYKRASLMCWVRRRMQTVGLAGLGDYQDYLEVINRRGKTIQGHITCTPLTDPEGEQQGVILLMEEV